MTRTLALMQFEPATSLGDVYKTLLPEPLLTGREIDAFYRFGLNDMRGGDKVANMALGLERSWGADFYKAFLIGHPGVGKSTELTRLVEKMTGRFRAIRFQATNDLDPGNFKPFDILLLMMMRIVEETAKPVEDGGAGKTPSDGLLQAIVDWFADEETTVTRSRKTTAEASVGIGPPATSLWQKVSGLFATLKGEMKYAADRSTKVVEYRLVRVSGLINLVNKLLTDCYDLLRAATDREWLLIGEDFDRPEIPTSLVEDFFLNHAHVLKEIQAHTIFSIPIGLVYSERATRLPCPSDRIHIVPDTPVFNRLHQASREGRAALQEILVARVSPRLFDRNQMKRVIVASGANLRDLFAMVKLAADSAILRPSAKGTIGKRDVDLAINGLRTDYERKLGVGPFDVAKLTYPEKAARLVDIYEGRPLAQVPDPVLYSLLNARAVQEFNGERWFGVHPLVVDILETQHLLSTPEGGNVLGGTK
jgi:hypothetical protein